MILTMCYILSRSYIYRHCHFLTVVLRHCHFHSESVSLSSCHCCSGYL